MKDALRILNLEDSADDAVLNKAVISERWPGCELVRVESRRDFVAALEQGGFDLILSDYTMPEFNGPEALALTLQMRPEVPFVFVSGTIGEDAAVEALKHGATDYVLKHRLTRLIPAIDRALRETEARAGLRRAEEAVLQSEHKYRELFESLGASAFLVDEQNGEVVDANRRAETLLGYTRENILGRRETQFLKLDTARAPTGSFGADAQTTTGFESELIRADGGTIPVEVRTTRLTVNGRAFVLRLALDIGVHITGQMYRQTTRHDQNTEHRTSNTEH